jgi:hypothetical protein
MTYIGLLKIKPMFNFKNIIVSTSPGMRDDYFGAMTSFIPPRSHLDSN